MRRFAVLSTMFFLVTVVSTPRAGLAQVDIEPTEAGGRITYEELIKVPTARDPWRYWRMHTISFSGVTGTTCTQSVVCMTK